MTTLRQLARRGRRAVFGNPTPGPLYLVSAAGQPNFGDEFITRVWLEFLARAHPDVDVWLDCPEPGRAAHIFRRSHPRLRTTNTLWQLAQLPAEEGPAGFPVIERFMRDGGSPKIDLGLRALGEMGSIHLLGGGYIASLWPRHLGVVMGAVAARRQFGMPLYITGQGWVPQDTDARSWLRGARNEFDVAEARDEQTAEEFELDLGVDDAYLAFGPYTPPVFSTAAPDVMLLLQGDMIQHMGREATLAVLDAFLTRFGRGRSVGVMEAIPPEDSWLLDDVRRLAPRAIFVPFTRVWQEGFPAHDDQQWLTTRFHAHLVAAAGGAAGTVVSVLPGYYDVKHELLLRNGTGWAYAPSVQDLAQHMPAPTRSLHFPETARAFGAEKLSLAARLYPWR